MCMYLCCSLGSACCNCLCWPAKALGVAQSNHAKLGYVLFHLIWLLIAIIVAVCTKNIYGEDGGWISDLIGLECDPKDPDMTAVCTGVGVFVRISFTLVCFHVFMLLITMTRT